MNHTTAPRLQHLLAPISPAAPAGEDLAYSTLFDDIRAARHGDDASLAQGDWARVLKTPEWPRAAQLCEDALATRSKDLQLAVWLVEAQVRWQGFAALAAALDFIAGLLDTFWDSLHPQLDGGDAGERAARLEWLDRQLGEALRTLPLTAAAHGSYSWHDYDAARDADNRRRAGASDAAVDEPGSEQFDRALTRSGDDWLRTLHTRLDTALAAAQALDEALLRHFGAQAPGLARLHAAIADCRAVVARSGVDFAASVAPPASATAAIIDPAPASAAAISPPSSTVAGTTAVATAAAPIPCPATASFNRDAAIRQLHEVAAFFRRHEPHSPVALLVERAARWAEMSFEDWLQAVIRDGATLDQLQQLLEFPRRS